MLTLSILQIDQQSPTSVTLREDTLQVYLSLVGPGRLEVLVQAWLGLLAWNEYALVFGPSGPIQVACRPARNLAPLLARSEVCAVRWLLAQVIGRLTPRQWRPIDSLLGFFAPPKPDRALTARDLDPLTAVDDLDEALALLDDDDFDNGEVDDEESAVALEGSRSPVDTAEAGEAIDPARESWILTRRDRSARASTRSTRVIARPLAGPIDSPVIPPTRIRKRIPSA